MKTFLKASKVGLDLPVFTQKKTRSATSVYTLLGAAFGSQRREMRTILDNVSFSLAAGDRLALIGRNGAGKSTLLKVLVGAYQPTRGQVVHSGQRQALLNINLGFQGDATLVENVMLRGIAMGMPRAKVSTIIDEVMAFSELEEKAADPLNTLSTGQRMRLGFALATAVQHDILLMDEWIGTGDAAFVDKAKKRIKQRVDNADVVVLASHNERLLRDVCTKGLLVEGGVPLFVGPVDEAMTAYKDLLGCK